MQSRSFSRNTKEGRGDTSAWTDSPLDKAEKAKQNYLEAYDRTKALADVEDRKKSSDADLVDKYNSSKRSTSLVQKHKEETKKHVKKKSKQPEKEREEWVGQHPWKPWDREKDLAAGRKQANFDSEGYGPRFDFTLLLMNCAEKLLVSRAEEFLEQRSVAVFQKFRSGKELLPCLIDFEASHQTIGQSQNHLIH